MPPLILVKSEGGVLYGTTDLATIIERVRDYDPDLILYVVDHRQHGHFEQVFRAADKAGLERQGAELEHVGYGTMNGADGKPFKTRAGGVMKLYDLIAMATAEANKRLAEQGMGADYTRGRTSRHRPPGRHRHHQIRRSLQPPHHRLYFRPGAVLQIRRQDRALSAICRGAHPVDPAQGRGRGPCGRRARASIRRRSARWCCSLLAVGECDGRGRGKARPQHSVRLCLRHWRRASAAFMPPITFCRKPMPGCAPPGWGFAPGLWRVLTAILGLLGIEVPERM